MAASGESTIHNSNTGRDSSFNIVSRDEEHEGGDDLGAAKRWEFNFDEI